MLISARRVSSLIARFSQSLWTMKAKSLYHPNQLGRYKMRKLKVVLDYLCLSVSSPRLGIANIIPDAQNEKGKAINITVFDFKTDKILT